MNKRKTILHWQYIIIMQIQRRKADVRKHTTAMQPDE